MSYGYFQGQEAQALGYYKKLLETQTDPEERKQLEELVAKLEKIVAEQQRQQVPPGAPVQNSCAF